MLSSRDLNDRKRLDTCFSAPSKGVEYTITDISQKLSMSIILLLSKLEYNVLIHVHIIILNR